MPDTKITVPNEISRVDALKGLWRCSSPARFFQTLPNDELRKKQETAAWKNKVTVEKNIQSNPLIDYFGGRCIKTDMSKFPEIDLASYKKQCEIDMSFQEIFERCIRHP